MDEKLLVALARNKQKQRPLKIKAKVGFKGLVSDAILEFNKVGYCREQTVQCTTEPGLKVQIHCAGFLRQPSTS